jgi:hypothetical protein
VATGAPPRRRPTRGIIESTTSAAPAAPMTSFVQLLVAMMPRMSVPSDSAISAPTSSVTPTMNAIDFAPQWIGAPRSSNRPAAANTTQVQPLPSMPRNVSPLTVPLGASNEKL